MAGYAKNKVRKVLETGLDDSPQVGRLYITNRSVKASTAPSCEFFKWNKRLAWADNFQNHSRSFLTIDEIEYWRRHIAYFPRTSPRMECCHVGLIISVRKGQVAFVDLEYMESIEYIGIEYQMLIGEKVVWLSYASEEGFLNDWYPYQK